MTRFAVREYARTSAFSVSFEPMVSEDRINFSDTSLDTDFDMALSSSPFPESPVSLTSAENDFLESARQLADLDPQPSKPVPESEELLASPSPLELQPLSPPELECVSGTEASTLQPSLDSISTFQTHVCHEAGITAVPWSPDPESGFCAISEDTSGHILAMSPQLASIPEESVENSGSEAKLPPPNLQSTSSIAANSLLSDANHAADESAIISVPTEQVSAPSPFTLDTASDSYITPPPPYASTVLQAETEDPGDISDGESTNDETNSVFDDEYHSETSSYTASLLSDVKDYTYENGRRYHSYREGHYVLPNDDQEQDRQDLLHHVRNLVLNGALFRAPLGNSLQRALDIGTGTGIWAIDFADSHPSAEVMGTDLSPIQPSWVPPNLQFLVDDAESPWLFSTSRPFDFIHARDLGGAIADWPRLLRQAYTHLRPGGWVELQEFEVTLRSDDDSLRLAPTLCEFLGRLHEASEAFHRPMNIAEGHRQRLVEAGFKDVRDEVYKVPSSMWPKDPIQKQIGRYNLCSLLMAVESYSLALFTRVLGWSNIQTQVFLAGVRRDLNNPEVHTYCNLHVVYGRKPKHDYHSAD
ncbi:uncharacterized protein N7484_010583 [Penicillium longicatenatum]|uniref:uncharacterized protein n=1 Tax=Penicillium longicatenatum TaxID=1561947 RepID=UPI002547771E|nr:uncharacterized protein N7484_010583 [Penicillium longicatenatum]KAJ5630483.1 hypothetical protein N7484_010583 [Penicillium longicatenatum]